MTALTPSRETAALKSEVIQLAGRPALNFFRLAQALGELHGSDPGALQDLSDRTRLSRRRMYYLLQTGDLIRDRGISEKIAGYIGWTKLQIVARHLADADGSVSRDEFTQLLALASERTARDLPTALIGKKVIEKRVAHFYLNTRERTLLNKALVMYGATESNGRLTGKEKALMKILREVTDPTKM